MPPGVEAVVPGIGDDKQLYYEKDGKLHNEEEARKMGITHSSLPTKSGKVKK